MHAAFVDEQFYARLQQQAWPNQCVSFNGHRIKMYCIADAGYALEPFLMVPYRKDNPLTPDERVCRSFTLYLLSIECFTMKLHLTFTGLQPTPFKGTRVY